MRENHIFLNTWFKRVWLEEDQSAIEELWGVDCEAKGLTEEPIVGPEEFKLFHNALCALLTEIDIQVRHCLDDGDWTAGYCTLNAKCRETGAPVTISGSVFVRIDGGKILEGYNHFDFLGMFSQIGLLPADAMTTCLQGKRSV